MININPLIKKVSEHSPVIFACAAVCGTIGTAVLAVKATPKALTLIEEAKKEQGTECLTVRQTVHAVQRCYIPTLSCGLFTIGCILAGYSIGAKRNAHLLAAYGVSETARQIYSAYVRDNYGNEEETVLRQKTAVDIASKTGRAKGKLIPIDLDKADLCPMDEILPCQEYISGQEFYASQNQIKNAISNFNKCEMEVEGKGCVNDLYSYFHNANLREIPGFDNLGWNTERNGMVQATITPHLDEAGKFYLIVDYLNPPVYGYEQ